MPSSPLPDAISHGAASRKSSEASSQAACQRLGGTMFTDGWPGFEASDGWRYRVCRSGTFWVAIHHGLGKTGRGAWPEQAREQAIVREFD